MVQRICSMCGAYIQRGKNGYRLKIQIVSDFDGYIEETGESLEDIISEIEDTDPEELERSIFEEIELTVCSSCRSEFLSLIMDRRNLSDGDDRGRTFH